MKYIADKRYIYLFSETKVVPIFAVVFTMIYWGVAINFYLDK